MLKGMPLVLASFILSTGGEPLPSSSKSSVAEESKHLPDAAEATSIALSKSFIRTIFPEITSNTNITCQIDSEWLEEDIISEEAREYLGPRVDEDTPKSPIKLDVSDAIGSEIVPADNLCSEDQSSRLWDDELKKLRSVDLSVVRASPKRTISLKQKRIYISKPVFSKDFETAAIVVSYFSKTSHRMDPKDIPSTSRSYDSNGYGPILMEGATFTYVYRREGADWKKVFETLDSIAN